MQVFYTHFCKLEKSKSVEDIYHISSNKKESDTVYTQ